MSNFINFEAIHALPFANANRDDSGLPKQVQVGGVTRGRLSSQSLKRAARFYGADRSNGFGDDNSASNRYFRTKLVRDLLEAELKHRGVTDPAILARPLDFFKEKTVLGKLSEGKGTDKTLRQDTLMLVTVGEIQSMTDYILSDEYDPKQAIAQVVKILNDSGKRDIALWGRFFASNDNSTMDGSAQVAHAFTTHKVALESDFFVGLDDASPLFSDHAGAGHPDNAQYLTGTFYKHANVNIEETLLNLVNGTVTRHGVDVPKPIDIDEVTREFNFIIEEFIRSMSLSVPQGKIRSTAHTTLPSLIRISLRTEPVNGATAFEYPISHDNKGVVGNSIDSLASTHRRLTKIVGEPEYAGYVHTDHQPINSDASALGADEDTLNNLIAQTIGNSADHVRNYLNFLVGQALVDGVEQAEVIALAQEEDSFVEYGQEEPVADYTQYEEA